MYFQTTTLQISFQFLAGQLFEWNLFNFFVFENQLAVSFSWSAVLHFPCLQTNKTQHKQQQSGNMGILTSTVFNLGFFSSQANHERLYVSNLTLGQARERALHKINLKRVLYSLVQLGHIHRFTKSPFIFSIFCNRAYM